MKALSIRQPWAWLIVNGYKPLENRNWRSNYQGILLIHASLSFDSKGYQWVVDNAERLNVPLDKLPKAKDFPKGAMVGFAYMRDCCQNSDSPWFTGPYGFILDGAKPLTKPYPAKGTLGIFDFKFNCFSHEQQ